MTTQYLTSEGREKLQEELKHLKTVRREEVAQHLYKVIEEGDNLVEDPAYEAAKNEQAFVEGRILELEHLLASAEIIKNGSNDVVGMGSVVHIKEDDLPSEKYCIVGEAEANPREGRISHNSPLGKSLMGHKRGEIVEVKAPSGVFSVKITKID